MAGRAPAHAISWMSWAKRFRRREHLRGSLWFLPLMAAVAGPIVAEVCARLEGDLSLPPQWHYSSGTASTVLTAIVGAMVALTGFVVTLGVLIVQLATGMLSPRFMRLWYRDALQKAVLGVFLGTLTFAFALLRHIEPDKVPNLGVTVAGFLVSAGLVLFLLYLNRFVHRLRPVEVAALMARAGARVFVRTSGDAAAPASLPEGAPDLVVHSPDAGAIQAFDERGLLRLATRRGCVYVLRHPVGDFITRGTPMVAVWGRPHPKDADRLRGMVALGRERTLEQDPAFALRILVDIALMALSPAVNAPTTAVQVLDYVEELLQTIGEHALGPQKLLRDGAGRARVALRDRTWEQYLELAVVEVRIYGLTAPQVTRRLHALLDGLSARVRPEHRAAVQQQLEQLEDALARSAVDARALAVASEADRQGIGGVAEPRRLPSDGHPLPG